MQKNEKVFSKRCFKNKGAGYIIITEGNPVRKSETKKER